MIRKRARRDEQKEARRHAILQAAWVLFQGRRYEEINIQDVAQAVGLAKGTLYLYFSTKEALFLEIQHQGFEELFDSLDAGLNDMGPAGTSEQVVSITTTAFVERPHLVRLFAILHVVLEHNIDADAARRFKHMLLERILHTARLLEQCLPRLDSRGAEFLLQAYALAIGVQHMADPAPVVRTLLAQDASLAVFRIDFASAFARGLSHLLAGYMVLD